MQKKIYQRDRYFNKLSLLTCTVAQLFWCPAGQAYYLYDYIDRTGKPCIEKLRADERIDRFEECKDFHNGRAIRALYPLNFYFNPIAPKKYRDPSMATPSPRYFYVDKDDSEAIGPYRKAEPFSEGLAVVTTMETGAASTGNETRSIIDNAGRIQGRFEGIRNSSFVNGLLAVQILTGNVAAPRRWGYVDRTGKWRIAPQFLAASDFSNALGCIQVVPPNSSPPVDDDEAETPPPPTRGYVNAAGKLVIAPKFHLAAPFSEQLAFFGIRQPAAEPRNQDAPEPDVIVSAIDTAGKTKFSLSTPMYSLPEPFRNQRSLLPGSTSYIDTTGSIAINGNAFDRASSFAEGLACVRVRATGKYGFIDATGKMIIPAAFDGAMSFSQGLAPVQWKQKWGFIDKSGRMVIAPRFLAARPFSDGLAAVITKRFSREEFRQAVLGCTFCLVDPANNEIRARCHLVQYPGKKSVLVCTIRETGQNANKISGDISVSSKGNAALGSSELQLQSRLIPGKNGKYSRINYGTVKVAKMVANANIAFLEIPGAIGHEGLKLTTDIPQPTRSRDDNDHNQLVLSCGEAGFDSFVSGKFGDNLEISLRPVLAASTYGGEAILNSNGEFVGMVVSIERNHHGETIEALPATAIVPLLEKSAASVTEE